MTVLLHSDYVARLFLTRRGAPLAGQATLRFPRAGWQRMEPLVKAVLSNLSTPAKVGEQVVVYAVGFGLPGTSIVNGSSVQTGSLPALPSCQIGGNTAPLSFAGLISPGLYQINITVPTVASGDNPIVCTYGGSPMPMGDMIAVQ